MIRIEVNFHKERLTFHLAGKNNVFEDFFLAAYSGLRLIKLVNLEQASS